MAIAFEQVALALTAAVTTAPIEPLVEIDVACSAPDRELLLVEWLNAIIYEMAVRTMVFGRFQVQASETQLQARLWGEAVDVKRHEPACEPKGATYTALSVTQNKNGNWLARCVVDV